MKTVLNNLATIRTGVFAKPYSEGEIAYLQAKHFDDKLQLESNIHSFLKPGKVAEKHLLNFEDVLFAAKGTKNFAVLYKSKARLAVASTTFFVISLEDNFKIEILPGYLAWYLNQPLAQNFLKARARGTSMVSISKAVLEELEIPIPDLQTQKTILKIADLQQTEKELQKEIVILREKQIQQKIINSIK